jgi:cephalosporin-C deacetylase
MVKQKYRKRYILGANMNARSRNWFIGKRPFALSMIGLLLLGRLLAPLPCSAQQLMATPFNPSGTYGVGEKVGWTVALPSGVPAPMGNYTYTVKKNNLEAIKSGELDLSSGSATIETAIDEPAMLFVQVMPGASAAGGSTGGRRAAGMSLGAAVAPTKLQPLAQRPEDFDSFWDAKLNALAEVPLNPVVTVGQTNKENIEFDTVQLDSLGSHARGYLAKPKADGRYPAVAIFEWAGVHALSTNTVTDRAAQGWLAFNVESHDMPPDQGSGPPQNYQAVGNTDKEQSYFLQMYLRDCRAIDYLASRPDWDGKTLVVMGTSMGGQQSLCVAGLHPKITHLIVNEPAGCDTNGQLHGRQAGYPNWPANNPKIMETALYFDPVNFAPRIKATSLVAMGFVDTIAPPAGIWTAFNQIHGSKEAAPMVDSAHNNQATPAQQRPYTSRSAQWLSTLVKGEAIEVQ